ncbi:MAG: hypothetical protein ACK4UN_01230 [Limisphaerales bacterium]
MNLVGFDGERYIFEFRRREREVFAAILRLYPVLNPDYHQLSRSNVKDTRVEESQALLQEAMAEQREANRKQVAQFLEEGNWEEHENRFRVSITKENMEWLLQVLNDIRVGSWVILGKPDPDAGDKPKVTLSNMPYAGAMELCGYFQMALLEARQFE